MEDCVRVRLKHLLLEETTAQRLYCKQIAIERQCSELCLVFKFFKRNFSYFVMKIDCKLLDQMLFMKLKLFFKWNPNTRIRFWSHIVQIKNNYFFRKWFPEKHFCLSWSYPQNKPTLISSLTLSILFVPLTCPYSLDMVPSASRISHVTPYLDERWSMI